ncbi:hypothetical protein QBC47DRAFT_378556 [Echria macrotheca]|uniref:Uncharacterized protein n=1 Tax=Echria macrotheca TaxID=438768 RepID=A0AAJ0BJR5_9PEZI|nr:hypothetical protein QBC47DRAFT_378556 [Echria macrotheca]
MCPSSTSGTAGTGGRRRVLGAEQMTRAGVQQYLNGPPSVAEKLLFGEPVVDIAALVKARKAATNDMLATWQQGWDKASH